MYANTVKGASDTLVFLQFFDEASHCLQPDGRPVLEYGDHIIVDNCAIWGVEFSGNGWTISDVSLSIYRRTRLS